MNRRLVPFLALTAVGALGVAVGVAVAPQDKPTIATTETTTTAAPPHVTTSTAPTGPLRVSQLIGLDPHQVLIGWEGTDRGGSVLGDDHGVGFRSNEAGDVVMILSRVVSSDRTGATSVIVDAVPGGVPLSSETYASLLECRTPDGRDDRSLLAIASGTDPTFNPAVAAWRVDLDHEVLTPVSDLDGITCWTGNPD